MRRFFLLVSLVFLPLSLILLSLTLLSLTLPAIPAMAAETAETVAPMAVVVGIPPVGHLVEQIGGRHVAVQVLSPAGQCAHQLSLTPKQTMELGRARLFLTIGMPFETQLQTRLRGTLSKLDFVDVAAGIKRRTLGGHACTHQHNGRDCTHDHGRESGDDPHVWLSPALLRTIAANVEKALAAADPDRAAEYGRNREALDRQIAAAAERVEKSLAPLRGQTVYLYHPSLGYLLDAYGLKQVAVEASGRAPSARELRDLIKQARADGVKMIFVEQQSDRRAAETVANAVGATVVPFDPLARDVVKNLELVAGKIAEAAAYKR